MAGQFLLTPAPGGRICPPHPRKNRTGSGKPALPQNRARRRLPLRGPEVRSRIFFKLMAAFLVVIIAATITFDVMIGDAWRASLRAEIERNLIQKTQLLAHRVETDRAHSLADIAAQEGQSAGARVTIIDPTRKVLADPQPTPPPIATHP